MQLSLHNGSSVGVTIISNIFIDSYMPQANGEFVKIYLYLLRCLKDGQKSMDLSSIADVFGCTETDIIRALRYWEAQKLVVLSGKEEQTSIDFLEPMAPVTRKKALSAAPTREEAAVTSEPSAPSPEKSKLTADRVKELRQNEDVRQMLFIAEQYMGTTLSRTVIDELLFIYENLGFSVDLIDYLIEYCVSKGSKDIHYIKKVAQNWKDAGIDTVTRAKQDTTTYHKNYFSILKAFGVTNRNPITSEIQMMNHWISDYGFTMEIITEACMRTVAATGKANFNYADKILSKWKDKGVKHISDIQALDALHRQLQSERAEQKQSRKASASTKFNNFQQRDYDYTDLESKLLQ